MHTLSHPLPDDGGIFPARSIESRPAFSWVGDASQAVAIASQAVPWCLDEHCPCSKQKFIPSFHKTRTLDEAIQLAEKGWPDAPKISQADFSTLRLPSLDSFGQGWDVMGDAVDISAYLTGEPECMLAFQQPAERPILRLGVNICENAGVKDECLALRGAAATAIVESLQIIGVPVELYALTQNRGNSADWRHYIRLKRSDEWAIPNKIAFWLANACAFRRIVFGMWERQSQQLAVDVNAAHDKLPGGSGYGRAISSKIYRDLWCNDGLHASITTLPNNIDEARDLYQRSVKLLITTYFDQGETIAEGIMEGRAA